MARSEILGFVRRFHHAMVDADIKTLTSLTNPDYYLVHITGFKQPRREWFDVIRTESYDYHSIEVDYDKVKVTEDGARAVVHGRGVFDATISGMHAPWKLEFKMHLANNNGDWTAEYSTYKSW